MPRSRSCRPDTDAATVRWTGGALDARPVVTPPPRLRVNGNGKPLPLPLEDHTHCQMIENVLWLCSPVGGHHTLPEACARLGLNVDAVERQFRRWNVPVPAAFRITEDGEPLAQGALARFDQYRRRRTEADRATG